MAATLILAACTSPAAPAAGEVDEGEARALEEAAQMLEDPRARPQTPEPSRSAPLDDVPQTSEEGTNS